jgi:hypothetical protein
VNFLSAAFPEKTGGPLREIKGVPILRRPPNLVRACPAFFLYKII